MIVNRGNSHLRSGKGVNTSPEDIMKRVTLFTIILFTVAFMASSSKPGLAADVLLVDDYLETDEIGNPQEYQERRRFYQRWGVYNFDYDVWVIADQGMPDLSTLQEYQAVLFASDGYEGDSDATWWYEVGSVGGGVLRDYMEGGGRLLAVGQLILLDMTQEYPPDPQPGDFEYDWLGVGSGEWPWDYWWWFTWAIGAEPGYPDSMMIDPEKLPEQDDYAVEVDSLRPEVDTLFLWGLWVDGSEPPPYMDPVAIIYRPGGDAVSALINFSLYFMPDEEAHIVMNNILRDEFGCTFYDDPAPLPPWHLAVVPIVGGDMYLSWDAIDEDDVATIRIYRSVDGDSYELYATIDGDAIDYTDQDISPGLVYAYRLTCLDAAGQEGDYSNEVSETGSRPQPPENLSAESGDGLVTLSWNHPDDPSIENYAIYRSAGFGGDYGQIAQVPSDNSVYLDSDVLNGNPYGYYATSINEFGIESYPSDTVFAYPHSPERAGILLVNGVDWSTYGSDIILMYEERALTGYFDYQFWDLFTVAPPGGRPHPETVIGEGPPQEVLFDAFQTIIWVGNTYAGDFEHWENNQDNIMNFLNTGGNMILPVRYGEDWFFEDLANYCGIVADSWEHPGADDLRAKHDSLTNISAFRSQSLWEIPMTNNPDNLWIYEAAHVVPGGHAGFITMPNGAGGGGAFCYIAGRSYRWNRDDLRSNFEIILEWSIEWENDCVYIPGDCDRDGTPLELNDLICMIGFYRGSTEPRYTCSCPRHSDNFVPEADVDGNCVPFELRDVIYIIGMSRGAFPPSFCADCPPSSRVGFRKGENVDFVPTLKSKARIDNSGVVD